jgi:hypothetical protein
MLPHPQDLSPLARAAIEIERRRATSPDLNGLPSSLRLTDEPSWWGEAVPVERAQWRPPGAAGVSGNLEQVTAPAMAILSSKINYLP